MSRSAATIKRARVSEVMPEQAVLGQIMSDATALRYAVENCRPALFQDQFHRRIFEAAKELFAVGSPVTHLTLKARLGTDPALKELPADYLEVLQLASSNEPLEPLLHEMRQTLGTQPEITEYKVRRVSDLPDEIKIEYLVKGLIHPNEMGVLFGEPGSGKSFLVAWMAYRIALGRTVLGKRTNQAPVLYAILESEGGFERRLAALRAEEGNASEFYWLDQPVDLFARPADVDGLISTALQIQAKLLVIDTLARSFGAGSENDGADMGTVIANVDHIRRETGAHVLLVHHSGKDTTKGARGHSSLWGATPLELEVRRSDGQRSMKVKKARDAQDGEEFGFDLKVVVLGKDQDGDEITTCIAEPTDVTPRSPRLTGATKTAFDLLIRALHDDGKLAPPGPHFPRDIAVVPLNLWRRYCFEGMGHDPDKPDAARKAFGRAKQTLQNIGRIGIWGDFVWVIS